MNVLTLEQIRALPEAVEFDAGIYFLWLNGVLQYIGRATNVRHRLYLHELSNQFNVYRATQRKVIPFDRHTCLVLENSRIRSAGLKKMLVEYEREYIAAHNPSMNQYGKRKAAA